MSLLCFALGFVGGRSGILGCSIKIVRSRREKVRFLGSGILRRIE